MRRTSILSLGLCLVGCGTTVIGERNSSDVGGAPVAATTGGTSFGLGGATVTTWNTSLVISTGGAAIIGGNGSTVAASNTGGAVVLNQTTSTGGSVTVLQTTSTGGSVVVPQTASTGGAATGGASQVGALGGASTTNTCGCTAEYSGGASNTGGAAAIGGTAATGGANDTGGAVAMGASGNTGGAVATGGAQPTSSTGGVSSGVIVELDQTHQTIVGFGISDVWADETWSAQTADSLFTTAGRGMGLSILRVGMNSSGSYTTPYEATDVALAKARGAKVIGSVWSPPANCKDNKSENDGGHLNSSCYAAWSDTIVKFAKASNLYAMSIANEPDFASCGLAEPCNGNYPTTLYTANELVAFAKVVGPKLQAAGIKAVVGEPAEWIHMWSNESATGSEPSGMNSSDPLKCGFPATNPACAEGGGYDYGHYLYKDKDAWAAVDILGVHEYDTQRAEAWPSDVPEKKPVWMTEMSGIKWWPQQGPSSDIDNAIAVAGWIHSALVTGNAAAWVWWWLRAYATDDNEGLILKDGTPTARSDAIANYSKFVRPGYERVDVTGNPGGDAVLSAFKGNDGTVVIVAINKSGAPVTMQMTLAGTTAAASMKPWVTSASGGLVGKSAIQVNSGSFTATLESKSVTTFVSSLGHLAVSDCPPCVAEVVSTCAASGNCASTAGGTTHSHFYNACYENGINWEHASNDYDGSGYVKATNRDGSSCFQIDTELTDGANSVTVTAGNVQIAEGSVDPSGQRVIDCGSTPYVIDDTCGAAPSGTCTLSQCP